MPNFVRHLVGHLHAYDQWGYPLAPTENSLEAIVSGSHNRRDQSQYSASIFELIITVHYIISHFALLRQ